MTSARTVAAPSVEALHLQRGYGEGAVYTPVLQDLSLRFWPGQLSLVMGASGSGKSTLLAILGGLLRPQAGQVQVLGTPIWSLNVGELERFRFRHFGFVFQGFNLFSALTALQQVMLPMQFADVADDEARARAEAALVEVGLAAQLRLRPAQLSGGEKQRVAIARALVTRPAVLLADEPTSALDSRNSERVIDLLRRIAAAHHTTVIAVTHDPRLLPHADRVIELRDGKVLSDEQHASIGA